MLGNKSIYLIVKYSGTPSGAEKRFIRLWKDLILDGSITYLITHKKTLNYFSFNDFEKKLIILYDSKKLNYVSQFKAILKIYNKIDKGSILHFTNAYFPFLAFKTRSKFIISWLQPFSLFSISNIKIRQILLYAIGFLFASKIDVLNPRNFYIYKKICILKKIYNTPLSVNVDPFQFKPIEKKNSIVFLGRLEENKGINKLLDTIKSLNKYSKNFKIENINFYILGKGTKQKLINKLVQENNYRNINVKCFYTLEPYKYLNQAKIFLSFQQSSNYPSRSLVESMISGCIPILTNTGESKLMDVNNRLIFLSNDDGAIKLCDIILNILCYDEHKFNKISMDIRNKSISKFINKKQFNYFKKIYSE